MKPVILASQSPRRKILLKKLGISFKVIPSKQKEPRKVFISCEHHAIILALTKATAVAENLSSGLVIGADTIVVYKNKIYGKPQNKADAKRILSTLSNTTHYVYTALALIDAKTGKTIVDIEKTKVISRKLTSSQIEALADKNHDKAGAYAVQEKSDILVKKLIGDYYNVVGLPLEKLKILLKLFK